MKISDIGNTELKKVLSLSLGSNQVFAKCEFQNPTGSHKDRTFLHIIENLEHKGAITPGMTLIDCSTGNGAAALAWIGREKGYNIIIFMPEGMTDERIAQTKSFGASIIETNKADFLNGAVRAAEQYMERNPPNTYFLNQGSNLLNKESWHACGREMVKQCNELRITPTHFICSIGTGGTFSGIAEILKSAFPNIRTVGIEVDRSAPLYSKRHHLHFTHQPHNMMGLGGGVLSDNTNESIVDAIQTVNGEEAWLKMKEMIKKEGVGIGPTCGANLLITQKFVETYQNLCILTVYFDSAWKYKSRWSGIYPEYHTAPSLANKQPNIKKRETSEAL